MKDRLDFDGPRRAEVEAEGRGGALRVLIVVADKLLRREPIQLLAEPLGQIARQYDIGGVAFAEHLASRLLDEPKRRRDEVGHRGEVQKQPGKVETQQAKLEDLKLGPEPEAVK
ncbi:hypothetical protein [Sphingomonas sp. NPDC079357]|uniref:hypothetical protein n=1 Tax=Sphingomonas sp. NPDC079357 TaxID=3364518 RepID=UPI00384ED980